MTTPTRPAIIATLDEAITLAQKLAKRDNAPAYVVLEGDHPHLASSWCVGEGKPWSESQVVYRAEPQAD